MSNTIRIFPLLLIPIFLGCNSVETVRFSGNGEIPDPFLFGNWAGQGTVSAGYCRQKELRVSLMILEDGSVYGKVGDAVLTGRLIESRKGRGDFFAVQTDYTLDGRLDGPIVKAEQIVRRRVRMALDMQGGHLVGSLETDGARSGNKDTMRFTAVFLTLRKMD